MDREEIDRHAGELDSIALHDDQVEYWLARDVMPYMGYNKWDNFSKAIDRAEAACRNSGNMVDSHFQNTTRDVPTVNGGTRSIQDVKLTRYACYLVAQNGDPRKEEVALLQSYFALQTRKVELIEQRMSEISRIAGRNALTADERMLSRLSYQHGVDERGFGYIRSRGDQALFSIPTRDMKQRLGVPASKPLADRLHPIDVTAKQLATQMTNYGIEGYDLHGRDAIAREHVDNNKAIRRTLIDRGITPEDLPAVEDIKNVERRTRRDEKRIEGSGFSSVDKDQDDKGK